MIGLLQRVTHAVVAVHGETVARIGPGLLVLVGIERLDDQRTAARLAERLTSYRVFPDDAGRMNRSLTEVAGELLLVPQFTLAADTRKGNRAGFSHAAEPTVGQELFGTLVSLCRERVATVSSGPFGADMQVSLTNDGPVTFWLRVAPQAFRP